MKEFWILGIVIFSVSLLINIIIFIVGLIDIALTSKGILLATTFSAICGWAVVLIAHLNQKP